MFPAPLPFRVLLAPPLVLKLLIALAISTLPRPSMVPLSRMSFTSAVIVTVGSASAEFSPICDTAASTVAILPASSFAAVAVLISVGMIARISTEPRPKAAATSAFLAVMVLAKLLPAN